MSAPQFCPYCGRSGGLIKSGDDATIRGTERRGGGEVTGYHCKVCENAFHTGLGPVWPVPVNKQMIGQVYYESGMLAFETFHETIVTMNSKSVLAAKSMAKDMADAIFEGFLRHVKKEKKHGA